MAVRCPILVGRDAEQVELRDRLTDALAGRGGFAIVRGDAGLGKSRLCLELGDHARTLGVLVLVGRAVPSGVSTGYRPLAEVILQAVRRRGLPPDDPGWASWLAALGSIVPLPGVPSGANVSPGGSSALRGEALLRYFGWLAGTTALLVVLEDLHWADPDTLEVVEYLADNLSGEGTLCVATVRHPPPSPANDQADRLQRRDRASVVELGPLDDSGVELIARTMAPDISIGDLARVRRSAEGVPFLVEELVSAPGMPRSFAETVRARVEQLAVAEREVLLSAALLGRSVEWALLAAATGQSVEAVGRALDAGVRLQLLANESGEIRFRHALTRDGLLDDVSPPRRAALATAALAAVEEAHPGLEGPWAGIAADLAVDAGATNRAGDLLVEAGTRALAEGALATAADTLARGVGLLDSSPLRATARARWVQALSLAGRVDEAMTAGRAAVAELRGNVDVGQLTDVHLYLAQAAVAAARWSTALDQIARARAVADEGTVPPGWRSRAAVIEAEARFATDDVTGAVRLAGAALDDPDAAPEARCHACELLGRSQRMSDLAHARSAFERGLAIADDAMLPVWRLRALHELATIELLDAGGTGRLLEARLLAESLGALSTAAMLDIQLAAAEHLRFELDDGARYARDALELSERLGLDHVKAMALWFLAEAHALALDAVESERVLALAQQAAPGDAEIEGMAWAGARAITALLRDDRSTAMAALEKGMAILPRTPQSPGHYRGMWPLLLAAGNDHRAAAALAEARRLGISVNRINRGFLGLAEAILRGRRGDTAAPDLAATAIGDLARYPVWRELGLLLVGEAARRDGWGTPDTWLAEAAAEFERRGLKALAERSRTATSSVERRRVELGVTRREMQVLDLVSAGLANKEIATRLSLSVRTVEKHVESLLRKTTCSSRTQLVALVRT